MACRGRQQRLKFARWAGARARVWARSSGFGLLVCLSASPALAQSDGPHGHAVAAELTLITGLTLFSGFVALLYLSQRRRWMEREAAQHLELMAMRAKLDRAGVFLGAETQIIAAWVGPGEEPDIEGDLELAGDRPNARRVLAFSTWLPPAMAQTIEKSLARLRATGEAFLTTATSLDGLHLEIEGRPVAGIAILRIKDVSGARRETARLQELQAGTLAQVEALRALLDATPYPAWLRDGSGKLNWVNAAYAGAVEAKDRDTAISRGIELIESPAREAGAASRMAGVIWHGRAAAVVAGERRMLEIVDAPAGSGSAGIAADVSEIEFMRAALDRQTQAHARKIGRAHV